MFQVQTITSSFFIPKPSRRCIVANPKREHVNKAVLSFNNIMQSKYFTFVEISRSSTSKHLCKWKVLQFPYQSIVLSNSERTELSYRDALSSGFATKEEMPKVQYRQFHTDCDQTKV